METKEILIIVLIGVLLIAVGMQTIQLTGLTKASVSTSSGGSVQAVSGKATTNTPSTPTNLQNIPSMVGGC